MNPTYCVSCATVGKRNLACGNCRSMARLAGSGNQLRKDRRRIPLPELLDMLADYQGRGATAPGWLLARVAVESSKLRRSAEYREQVLRK